MSGDSIFDRIMNFCASLFLGSLAIIATLVLGLLIIAACASLYVQHKWCQATEIEWVATLISRDYYPSTQTGTTGTVYIDGRVGVTHHTAGCSEKKVTVWDAGKYGRLESKDERVWRLAKGKSVLKIKELDGDVRIVGIKD